MIAFPPTNYLNTFLVFPAIFPSFPYFYSNHFPLSYVSFHEIMTRATAAQIPICQTLQRRYESIKQKTKISLNESLQTFGEIERVYSQVMALNWPGKRGFKQIQSLIVALATLLELLLRKSIRDFVFSIEKIKINNQFIYTLDWNWMEHIGIVIASNSAFWCKAWIISNVRSWK